MSLLRMTSSKVSTVYYIGACGFVYALFNWDWSWALYALVNHIFVMSIFSAVTHRYYCHQLFKAKEPIMFTLATYATFYAFPTPIYWAWSHATHHAYADTDKDPHIKGWGGLFTSVYRPPSPKFMWKTKWFIDGKHRFVHNNALFMLCAWHAILAFISFDAFIWLGLVNIFTLQLVSNLHRVLSHFGDKPRNMWFFEYLLPVGGEWIHKAHHDKPNKLFYSSKWYELDTGSLLIKLARTAG
jgi:fatty-acid desaturase